LCFESVKVEFKFKGNCVLKAIGISHGDRPRVNLQSGTYSDMFRVADLEALAYEIQSVSPGLPGAAYKVSKTIRTKYRLFFFSCYKEYCFLTILSSFKAANLSIGTNIVTLTTPGSLPISTPPAIVAKFRIFSLG